MLSFEQSQMVGAAKFPLNYPNMPNMNMIPQANFQPPMGMSHSLLDPPRQSSELGMPVNRG